MNHSVSPLKLLIPAAALVTTLWVFFFGVYTVEGRSMEPFLYPGKNVIILKRFSAHSIHRGDILVYKSLSTEKTVIKRCAAVAGETLQIEGEMIVIPENHFFALGDNRRWSEDSRHHGAVPFTALRGKVIFSGFGGKNPGE
jgi:signal peptidase I